MHILFPGRILQRHVGGNTTYTQRLYQGMQDKGFNVGLIPSAPMRALTAAVESAYALRRRSGTVLHFTADTGPALRTRTPSVVTVHGVASRWVSIARTHGQESIWRRRVQAAIRATDRIITVSASSAADVAQVFDVDISRIAVIPHGIDSSAYGERQDLSPALSEYEGSTFALYVGNLEPRKNLTALIAAFGKNPLRGMGVPLVIVGRPAWNYAEILGAISDSPWVRYIGFVDERDKVAMMQRCALFVFPSHYEGFGFPVLEAMAAGAAVACSDRGALKEVRGPAFALDQLDADGLASDLAALLSDADALDRCRKQGFAWARRFSWERSIDSHVAIYTELVA